MGNRLLLALALQRAGGLRPEEKLLLWDVVADEAALAALTAGELAAVTGRVPGSWRPLELVRGAEEDLRVLARIGADYAQYDDPSYPPMLRESSRPPFGVFLRGGRLPPDRPAAAVVGTRMPTGRGLAEAVAIGRELARAGVPVISGLARGIDSAAHRGALEGRGFTCAVLPCGIDAVYPAANKSLAAAILEGGGLLLSEYSPGSEMHKYRFPERNRIIASLARACVVVEAPLGSGALITADHALGEGRDLWVARACLGGQRDGGADRLAAQGAPATSGAADLLADWGLAPAPYPADSAGLPWDDLPSGACAGAGCGNAAGRRLAAALAVELELGGGGGRRRA